MLESAFSTKVIKNLRAMGGLWRKQPASRFGSAGVADIIGLVRGWYIEIELKAPGKYKSAYEGCSPLQLAHAEEVIRHGGIWIAGDDWDEIREALSGVLDS